MKKGSIFKFFSRAQPASEAGAAGGGGPEAGAAGGGGSGDATGSTVSEDPAADVDDAPPEEGEGSAKKQKLAGQLPQKPELLILHTGEKKTDENYRARTDVVPGTVCKDNKS
ncbi:hypothetical protein Bbelb_134180 [Branchiostoma belcheri]|nr:hypothetical protein Bbelb_134180 [Branchiostoma belcheri]